MNALPPVSGFSKRLDELLRSWLQLPRAVRLLVPIGIVVSVWCQSGQPQLLQDQGWIRSAAHNSMHVVVYCCLAGSLRLALDPPSPAVAAGGAAGVAWVLSTAYGGIDEWHQYYVPGRVSSAADLLSDAIGSGLGVLLVQAWQSGWSGRVGWFALLVLAAIVSVALAVLGIF